MKGVYLRIIGKKYGMSGKHHSEKTRKKMSKSHLGKLFTKEHKRKIRENHRRGKEHPAWKGDDVKYGSLHDWIRNHKPKPEFCEICNKYSPYDMANISGLYKRDINDFEWLCRKCHSKFDFPDGKIGINLNK